VKTCPNCGEENSDRARFCQVCAAPLSEAPAAVREERKVVTVLFCDLVGFTAASDQADPEDVRARIRPYHARLRQEIEGFGGTVEKFIGDAVMAVFGAPVAHEDDPERAVRAGLRILEAIGELNQADPELGLQVRIGITTGEAVVALGARPEQGEGMVTGDVVNTASRLQGVAPIGGIVIGEQTYRATSEVFDYEPLEAVTVKGKADPLPIWRAVAARSRFGTELTRTHATAMVGRDAEVTILRAAFDKSVRDRSVQLVTVVGGPGVGKSRLVAELFAHVDSTPDIVRWRQGRCLPYGEGITFWALGEIVKAEAGILESDSPETAAQKLDGILLEGTDREWLRERLLPLIGLEASSTAEREEAFTAWRRFLESLAEGRPSVFVLEDLHWADEAMLAFLEHLADWSEGVPMLLVTTARPELFERAPGWAGGKRNTTTINLSPLSDTETAHLISALLGQAVLPAEVQSLILERAGGNPLYAEEFVRLLKDRGLLVQKGKTLGLVEGAEVPFPEGVQALIAARLDTLSPERKAMLQDAAVIGKVFWAGAVAAMGGLDPRAVADSLHELSRKELVRPARVSSVEGEAEYSFWHILVRDVAYAQIPRAQRGDKHRRAASWMESMARDRVEDLAEVLAYHYTQALDLARATGQTGQSAELEVPARRFLLLAGERALGLDTTVALASLDRALALAPSGHPQRPPILARWAEAARQAGRLAEATAALEEAITAFKERGDTVGAARAMTALSNVLWFTGDPRSKEMAAEAVTLLESKPPGPDLVAAYAEKTRIEALGGEAHAAIGSAERTLVLASSLGLEQSAKALGYKGLARGMLGDAGGLEDLRMALTLAIERGQGREAAVIHNNLSGVLWVMEGPAASLAVRREGIEFAERRGIDEMALTMAATNLSSLIQLGDWDEVLEAAGPLAERLERAGLTPYVADIMARQARVLVMRGQPLEILPLEGAVETARDSGSIDGLVQVISAAALVRLAAGHREGALELLVDLEQTPHVRGSDNYPQFLPELVRTAVAAGDLALANRLASGLEPLYPYQEYALRAARAILAEAGGETEEAARLYSEAAERWEGFGVVPEQGFALLGRGRCLLALRDPAAGEALRQAREIFATLGAVPSVAEADDLLKQATALSS
jgi:class 3 adenylate cyclase/tetratricopeptide (TPR) repeat protein